MATFLVERFWPGLTAAGAETATTALARAGAVIVETIVADTDEVCLWYVEAAATSDVVAAFRDAAVPIDRIGPATRLRRRPASG
ncbi:MAG TPA: hypothetical protein VH720_05470 [Candidatus Limnocylindrales bacterium]|jgi:hypothetical protein